MVGGSLVTHKSESHMTAVCTAFSNCRSFRNLFDDTLLISSSIWTSHAPNQSKELDPFAPYPTLLLVPTQQNWKCALTMLWGMHISNVSGQFRLASEEFMQNDTIYNTLSHGNMVFPPIGINLIVVVCGCQCAYVFIFCGRRP